MASSLQRLIIVLLWLDEPWTIVAPASAVAADSSLPVKLPLIFEAVHENPFKTRIFLNPDAGIVVIHDMSRRDVIYDRNNESLGIEEKFGDWVSLVQNEEAPSIRYLQLKQSLCEEKDYRISWTSRNGKRHESFVQRLQPTPQEWRPNADVSIKVSAVIFDEPVVAVAIDFSIDDEQAAVASSGDEFDQLTTAEPVAELLKCETLFSRRVPPPYVNVPKKTIFFHSDYVDHVCTFALRLRIVAYDKVRKCKAFLHTSNEKSLNITLRCDKVPNYKCSDFDYVDDCRASCDVQLDAKPEHRLLPDRHFKPIVKLEWRPFNVPHRAKVQEVLIRLSAMDAVYNNFPMVQPKSTVIVINSSSYELTPYSDSLDSFIGVQICVFFDLCDRDPKWWLVPNHAVYAARLIDHLPPPPKLGPPKIKQVSMTTKPPIRKLQIVSAGRPSITVTETTPTLDQTSTDESDAARRRFNDA